MCRMPQTASLWHKKFWGDSEKVHFDFNNCDACVANEKVNGKQLTVRFHIDDCMSGHVDPKANDKFLTWSNEMHGEHSEALAVCGKSHDCSGMMSTFGDGEVKVDMVNCAKKMSEDFPVKFNLDDDEVMSVASADSFKEDLSKKLSEMEQECFHKTAVKGPFPCKRGRTDVQTSNAVLCSRVKAPGWKDWLKLVRMMKFLRRTDDDVLMLSVGSGVSQSEWNIDVAFGAHPDFEGHTGAAMKFKDSEGSPMQRSSEQKSNTGSGTACKLVGADDVSLMMPWTPSFAKGQGCKVTSNKVPQDNASAIPSEKNRERSSRERKWALDIQCFLMTDHAEKGHPTMRHCSAENMIRDFFTEPLQGKKFKEFRNVIVGFVQCV